jgi:cytochrome c oxidase assembly protein subunit 15
VTRRRTISNAAFRRITLGALVALYTIVITGALVRLTGSGLGCADWPRCSEERFIDVSTGHGAIEQVNRLFTGVVAASVILSVLGSLRLATRRRELTALSVGLVVGVLAQVVIGGIVVITGLNPWANMAHFLVSMVLLANGLVLHRLAADGAESSSNTVPTNTVPTYPMRLVMLTAVLGAAAVVTGTVVTATGPHAGDEEAVRFGFSIHHVARIHGSTVMATVAGVAILLWVSRGRDRLFESRVARLLGLALLQALVGYVQYLADVPALLVAVHIAFAAGVWLALVDVVWLALVRRSRAASPRNGRSPALSR